MYFWFLAKFKLTFCLKYQVCWFHQDPKSKLWLTKVSASEPSILLVSNLKTQSLKTCYYFLLVFNLISCNSYSQSYLHQRPIRQFLVGETNLIKNFWTLRPDKPKQPNIAVSTVSSWYSNENFAEPIGWSTLVKLPFNNFPQSETFSITLLSWDGLLIGRKRQKCSLRKLFCVIKRISDPLPKMQFAQTFLCNQKDFRSWWAESANECQ